MYRPTRATPVLIVLGAVSGVAGLVFWSVFARALVGAVVRVFIIVVNTGPDDATFVPPLDPQLADSELNIWRDTVIVMVLGLIVTAVLVWHTFRLRAWTHWWLVVMNLLALPAAMVIAALAAPVIVAHSEHPGVGWELPLLLPQWAVWWSASLGIGCAALGAVLLIAARRAGSPWGRRSDALAATPL